MTSQVPDTEFIRLYKRQPTGGGMDTWVSDCEAQGRTLRQRTSSMGMQGNK